MDLWEFVTALLYEYDFFYCVCAFTLLLCFWDMQIRLVTQYIVSCAICFSVAIIWHLYQRAQDRLREQCELDHVIPGLSPMPKHFDLALCEGNDTFMLWARKQGTLSTF